MLVEQVWVSWLRGRDVKPQHCMSQRRRTELESWHLYIKKEEKGGAAKGTERREPMGGWGEEMQRTSARVGGKEMQRLSAWVAN